jgi:hypothetical protein
MGWATNAIVDRVARETVDRRTTVTAPRTPSIACIAERDRGAASARRNVLGAAQGTTTESYEPQAHHNR